MEKVLGEMETKVVEDVGRIERGLQSANWRRI
jgi:hypothetical protein